MSNSLFPQSSSYPPMASMMFERPPPPTIVSLEPIKTFNSLSQDNRIGIAQLRPVIVPASIPTHPAPYFTAVPSPPMKKEMDDLARKQEEFILRCQYPKRILPGELTCDIKKAYYLERRRDRSGSPGETRRKSVRHEAYRGYSKSPSRLWRGARRVERSESLSPRRHPDYSPPGTRSPGVQTDPNTPHRNK